MTISDSRHFDNDRDQVLQDIYSNTETLQRFVRAVKAETLAEKVSFDRHHIDEREELIDLLVAENAIASITTLVCAEIQGGYVYSGRFLEGEDDEPAPRRKLKRARASK